MLSAGSVLAACAVALLVAAAIPADAETPPETTVEIQQPEVTVDGMNVAIDPETGHVRPLTPAEQRKLAAAMKKQFGVKAHPPVVHADGTLSVFVGTDYVSYSVARVAEDGSILRQCAEDQESAITFLAGGATQAPAVPPLLAAPATREEQ
jgi:hypothetical protein